MAEHNFVEHPYVEYHYAHCTRCAEKTSADRLAFDFGELINKAVQKNVETPLGANLKWEPLIGLDLCLYYTSRDLSRIFNLRLGEFSPFQFTVKNLRFQLQRFAGVHFANLVGLGIDTREYYRLVQHIKFANQQGQDVDVRLLAERIKEVVDLCSMQMSPDEDEVIAQFNVKVIMAEDDRGNLFANKLEIKYEDNRFQVVTNNVCPNCGKKFYSDVGKYEEIIIGMAGSARVGKTAYLASLVNSFIEKNNEIASVVDAKNKEWTFFKSTILQQYRNGKKIDKTAFEGGGETIPLFSIEIKVLGKSYIFTFIDMPGEVFDNPEETDEAIGIEFINNERRIINHAQMIWFCVAPEQIDADIAQIKRFTNAKQDEVNTKTAEVMANIRSTMAAVSMDEKLSAAVLVTMSDQILGENASKGLFKPDVDVCEDYVKNGCLDYKKTKEFCDLSKQYLDQAGAITTALNHIFRRYSVFAVAAYGKNLPQGTQAEIELGESGENGRSCTGVPAFKPTPSMVELPFFWTMAALGKLKEGTWVAKKVRTGFGPFSREVYVGDEIQEVSESELFQQENKG